MVWASGPSFACVKSTTFAYMNIHRLACENVRISALECDLYICEYECHVGTVNIIYIDLSNLQGLRMICYG